MRARLTEKECEGAVEMSKPREASCGGDFAMEASEKSQGRDLKSRGRDIVIEEQNCVKRGGAVETSKQRATACESDLTIEVEKS